MTNVQMISGALNPSDKRAIAHAEKDYASFRSMTTDCIFVSQNTGYTLEQVSLVKSYLFSSQHYLSSCDKFKRFDPSYEIAQSWRRLMNKKGKGIQRHDMLLVPHELLEISYIVNKNLSQQEAHELASKAFSYDLASTEYYNSLGFY